MTSPVLRIVAAALRLQRDYTDACELARFYAGDSGTAWDEAEKLNRTVWRLRDELEEARERAARCERDVEIAREIAREIAAHYAADAEMARATTAELDALRAPPRPRAHMDWEGES